MAAYSAASSSWRNAKPTVRKSAKISKPSKVQPRLEAISTFHCARFSERYHGWCRTDSWVDIEAPSLFTLAPSCSGGDRSGSGRSIGGGATTRQHAGKGRQYLPAVVSQSKVTAGQPDVRASQSKTALLPSIRLKWAIRP